MDLQSLRRIRLGLVAATLVLPLGCSGLLVRQAGRLSGLAERGIPVDAVVTAISRDGGGTHYAYRLDGVEHRWNVARAEAPFDVGAQFPVTVLPEVPSFSAPGTDCAGFALRASKTRRYGAGMVVGGLSFGLLCLGLVQRDIARASAGRPAAPVTPETYRRRLRWAGLGLAFPLVGISAWHANDSFHSGESLVPVALGALLCALLLGGLLGTAYQSGPEKAQERVANLLRWVVPLSVLLAAARLLLFLIGG